MLLSVCDPKFNIVNPKRRLQLCSPIWRKRMDRYIQEILNKKLRLEKAIATAEGIVSSSPDGALRISSCRGAICYYHTSQKGDTLGKYIHTANHTLTEQLAQKAYAEKVLREAKIELMAVERLLRTLRFTTPHSEPCFTTSISAGSTTKDIGNEI